MADDQESLNQPTKSLPSLDAYRQRRRELPKVKTSCYLTEEEAERLGLHALKSRCDQSDLLGWLINSHLRRFFISDTQRKSAQSAQTEAVPAPGTVPIGEGLTSAGESSRSGAEEGGKTPLPPVRSTTAAAAAKAREAKPAKRAG